MLKKYIWGNFLLSNFGVGVGGVVLRMMIYIFYMCLRSHRLSPQAILSILKKGASKITFYFFNRMLGFALAPRSHFAMQYQAIAEIESE